MTRKEMTRKEAKARLKFVAEWWSPEVAVLADLELNETPGCLFQIATSDGEDTELSDAARPIMAAWDRKDAAEAMRLIEAL